MSLNNLISLSEVSLILSGPEKPVHILHNVSLTVKKGEAVSIIGPSGSGKTSLMMLIAGVEKVSGGNIEIANENITNYTEDQLANFRRKNIGIIFQNFHLIPTMTALENVMLALEFSGSENVADDAKLALTEVGLAHRLDHYPSQLSGGEQQRVAIARAMATKPALLLADEPTGNLDSATGNNIVELLFGLREKYGTTLILITHDKGLAAKTSRSLTMQDGKLHE